MNSIVRSSYLQNFERDIRGDLYKDVLFMFPRHHVSLYAVSLLSLCSSVGLRSMYCTFVMSCPSLLPVLDRVQDTLDEQTFDVSRCACVRASLSSTTLPAVSFSVLRTAGLCRTLHNQICCSSLYWLHRASSTIRALGPTFIAAVCIPSVSYLFLLPTARFGHILEATFIFRLVWPLLSELSKKPEAAQLSNP